VTATLTNPIVFVVSRIEPTAPPDLEDHLLAAIGVGNHEAFRSTLKSIRQHPTDLAIDSSRPADLTDAQRRLADIKIACALAALNQTCPLRPGEHETASPPGGLLSAPWQYLPVGTPIVTRTTNYSTVHLAWPHVTAVNNQLIDPEPIRLRAGAANPCWTWDKPIPDSAGAHTLYNWITTMLSVSFALSGLNFLSPFLTFAGTVAFQAVSFKDVFQIATCRAQQISNTDHIDAISAALSGMNQELQDTYLPAKVKIAGTSGQARTNAMDNAARIAISIVTTNRNNISQLTVDNLGFDGLVPYVAGTSVVLSLYQELSTVDSSAATPAQSSYITSMRSFAGEAQGQVNAQVGNIRATRSGAIVFTTLTQDVNRCSGGISPTCITVGTRVVGARWDDQITGNSSGKNFTASNPTDAEAAAYVSQCQQDMQKYVGQVMSALDAKLKPLVDAAAQFSNIPVPPALPA